MRRTMSTVEAARLLGLSKFTIIRAYHAGTIDGFRTSAARNAHSKLYTTSVHAYQKTLHERQPAEVKAQP